MGAANIVAKKKTRTGPKPRPEGPRDALLAVKCWQSYKDWVVRIADHERETPSSLIDKALTEYARNRNLEAPPKR